MQWPSFTMVRYVAHALGQSSVCTKLFLRTYLSSTKSINSKTGTVLSKHKNTMAQAGAAHGCTASQVRCNATVHPDSGTVNW
jgi:hypothetical protein